MDSINAKLALILGGLGIVLAVLSRFSGLIESFFRRRADIKMEKEEASIDAQKGKVNEIHSENVTNINDYNKLKSEYDKSRGDQSK